MSWVGLWLQNFIFGFISSENFSSMYVFVNSLKKSDSVLQEF